MDPLFMLITYIPRILWEKGQMRMKEVYLSSKVLVAYDLVLYYAFSLSFLMFSLKSFAYIFEYILGC